MLDQTRLDKTNRINMLFDCYRQLLTEKQQRFLHDYFHEDFSLGEIADMAGISRQAIYEHIKRAEASLEDYECKLGFLQQSQIRQDQYRQLLQLAEQVECGPKEQMLAMVRKMIDEDLDETRGGERNGSL